MDCRRIGSSELCVSPVALGCWPIAGMTSLHVNDQDSLATISAAVDHGINFFDTAFCYGTRGESERLISRALGARRSEMVIATKGGLHWDPSGNRVADARPVTLARECEQSLERLGTDFVDLLYLHAPDPKVPIEQSAAQLHRLQEQGKTRYVGASNLNLRQLQQFHGVCPVTAFQPPYNMLQRQIEQDILPWCQEQGIAVVVYWPLMKGLLADRFSREHVFELGDKRATYPMYQGVAWQRNQDFLDRLRAVAREAQRTVAQLVVNWTIHQPGITVALCGAKRAAQIRETAGAMEWQLTSQQRHAISVALAERERPVRHEV